MNPDAPLTDLIPLWISTIRLRGQSPRTFKPYRDSTLISYSDRAKKSLSTGSLLTRQTWQIYFGDKWKRVEQGTLKPKTWSFEVDALNYFYEWAVDNHLIKKHPNKDYKSRWKKGTAKKR